MPRVIAHLSDLHFGTVPPGAVEALAVDIAAARPDLVAVTGDLTQHADPGEFAEAKRFLAALPCPWIAVPGNHDIPRFGFGERLFDPFGRWRRHLALPTEPVFDDGEMLVIGVNTVRRTAAHLDWSAGRVSGAQVARIARLADERRGRRIVIALHHPVRHPRWAAGRRALGRGGAMLRALRPFGVDALLAGHLHRAIAGGAKARPVELVAGSALSARDGGEGNSYNLVSLSGDGLGVTVRRHIDGCWCERHPGVAGVP
ncbi:metallophosphoesterase [Elioraea sp.]|uniref:metallophosphoesterase family protein n=1 Tax=Elioraea sp. TaxID=2185103 RepID=UPI0025BFA15F|nr:metallophosphoesterase [Elioraea sp.]